MKRAKVFFILLAVLGCAKVSIEAEKPIRVDINMRVDVYQHVVKDVESIEDEIYGKKDMQLNAILGFDCAYAQEYSPDVAAAIEKRKAHSAIIEEYFIKGQAGENKEAYLEVVDTNIAETEKAEITRILAEENSAREVIYRATAQRNGTDISEVTKVFFQNHYDRAPEGYWFQIYDAQKGQYVWKQK